MLYVLDGHQPREITDILEWAEAKQQADADGSWRVALDVVGEAELQATVSTVFLGLWHGLRDGEPVLFETMVFGGALDLQGWRYTNWAAAEEGHQWWLRRVAYEWERGRVRAHKEATDVVRKLKGQQ